MKNIHIANRDNKFLVYKKVENRVNYKFVCSRNSEEEALEVAELLKQNKHINDYDSHEMLKLGVSPKFIKIYKRFSKGFNKFSKAMYSDRNHESICSLDYVMNCEADFELMKSMNDDFDKYCKYFDLVNDKYMTIQSFL